LTTSDSPRYSFPKDRPGEVRTRGKDERLLITGKIRSKVDRIWDTMWSGRISNPLSIIDQQTARGVMDAAALYEPPFSNLHAGGQDALFAGKGNVIEAVFETLESLEPRVQNVA
jgi:hypothetical protein